VSLIRNLMQHGQPLPSNLNPYVSPTTGQVDLQRAAQDAARDPRLINEFSASTGWEYTPRGYIRTGGGGGSSVPATRTIQNIIQRNTVEQQLRGEYARQGYSPEQIDQIIKVNKAFEDLPLSQRVQEQRDLGAGALLSKISSQKLQKEFDETIKQPVAEYEAKQEAFLQKLQSFTDKYGDRPLQQAEYDRAVSEQTALQREQKELQSEFSRLQFQSRVESVKAQQRAVERQERFQTQLAGQQTIGQILQSGLGKAPIQTITDTRSPILAEQKIISKQLGVEPSKLVGEISDATRITERTPIESFLKGQWLESTKAIQADFEKTVDKEKQVRLDTGAGLILSSAAVGFTSITDPIAKIIAPSYSLTRKGFKESAKRLGTTAVGVGGVIAVAATRPIQTVVGVGQLAMTRPIQFTGELIGTAGAFKGLGKLFKISKTLVGKAGTKFIPAEKLTQKQVLKSVEAGRMAVPTSKAAPFQLAKQFSTGQGSAAKALGQPFGGISVSGEKLLGALKRKLVIERGKSEFFQPGFYIGTDASFGFARIPSKASYDLSKIKFSILPKTPSPSAVFVKTKVSVPKDLVGKSLVEQARAFGFDVSKLRPDIRDFIVKKSKAVELGKGKVTDLKIKFLEQRFGAKEIEKAFVDPTLPKGQAFITGKRLMGSPEIESVIPAKNILSVAKDTGILSKIKGYKFRTQVSGVDIPIFITEYSTLGKGIGKSLSKKVSQKISDVRFKRAVSSASDFEKGITYVPIVSSKSLGLFATSMVKPSKLVSKSRVSTPSVDVSSPGVSLFKPSLSKVSLSRVSSSIPGVSSLSSSTSGIRVSSNSGTKVSSVSEPTSVSRVSGSVVSKPVSGVSLSKAVSGVSKPISQLSLSSAIGSVITPISTITTPITKITTTPSTTTVPKPITRVSTISKPVSRFTLSSASRQVKKRIRDISRINLLNYKTSSQKLGTGFANKFDLRQPKAPQPSQRLSQNQINARINATNKYLNKFKFVDKKSLLNRTNLMGFNTRNDFVISNKFKKSESMINKVLSTSSKNKYGFSNKYNVSVKYKDFPKYKYSSKLVDRGVLEV